MKVNPVFIATILIWIINPYHYETGVRVGNAAFDSYQYAKKDCMSRTKDTLCGYPGCFSETY